MRDNKGAIAIFTLLAMLFFLIFVMMIYSNISSKAKAQVETTEILVDAYNSDTSSSAILEQMTAGDVTEAKTKTADQESVVDSVSNDEDLYLAIDGKIYN